MLLYSFPLEILLVSVSTSMAIAMFVLTLIQLRKITKLQSKQGENSTQIEQLQAILSQQHNSLQHTHTLIIEQSDRIVQQMHNQHRDYLVSQQQELRAVMSDIRQQLQNTLQQQTQSVNQHITSLQNKVDQHLHHIGGQVEKRLTDGFAKTQDIFNDVVKRLALIDQAQQKITDLSSNVVSLQDILSNKQARGHFGEVQLSQLIQNCIPAGHYAMQHTLSNKKRADCVLFLPEPTGTIAIDDKFPLENYRNLLAGRDSAQTSRARQLFRSDLKEHIKAVGDKYIITGETADAAVLFLPAESIFSEIYAQHPDLVEFAYQKKVWLVSPTTMMAILHTAQAVLRDLETQSQVHAIQKHLRFLSEDFSRFSQRMHYVAKHISDAQDKVTQVKISADKIAKRFDDIQCVKIDEAGLKDPNNLTVDKSSMASIVN